MDDAEVKERLRALHAELKTTRTVDKDSEELLRQIVEDVRALLSHKGELSASQHAGIRERMAESARHFDASHPSLAATLRTVVNSLNALGI